MAMNYGGFNPFGGGYSGMNQGYPGINGGFNINGFKAPNSAFSVPGLSGIGTAIKGIGGYFTDPEQGMQRQALASNILGAGASIYGARKAEREREQLREEEKRREEEEKKRRESFNPIRTQLLARMISGRE